MERTQLGPAEQFRDDSDAWKIGQRIRTYGGCELRTSSGAKRIAFRLYDSGEIVLVDPSRLEPNAPNPPKFSESQAWRDMADAVERLPG